MKDQGKSIRFVVTLNVVAYGQLLLISTLSLFMVRIRKNIAHNADKTTLNLTKKIDTTEKNVFHMEVVNDQIWSGWRDGST